MYRGGARYLKALRSHATPSRQERARWPPRPPPPQAASPLPAAGPNDGCCQCCQPGSHIPLHLTSGRRQAPVTPGRPKLAIFGRLMNASGSCSGGLSYQDVLVLSVSGFVFGRESLLCTGLLKDLAE